MSTSNAPRPQDMHTRILAGGPSNRIILSLLSGVPSEVDYALDRLRFYSAQFTDRLNLAAYTHALDGLLAAPQALLDLLREQSRWGEAGWELRGPEGEACQRRAIESLLILRNAGTNDRANGRLLGSSLKLEAFLESFFALPTDLLLDHLVEPTLLSLDIYDNLLQSVVSPPRPQSKIPDALPPLFKSRDRAVLFAVSRVTHLLLAPSVQRPPLVPTSHALAAPALDSALRLLLLPSTPVEKQLRSVSLDLLYNSTTDPVAAAHNLLARTDIGPVVRLLAMGLYDEAQTVELPFYLNPRDRIGIYDVRLRPLMQNYNPDDWRPSEEELDDLVLYPEPDRCTQWITRSFKADPAGKVTQTAFWTAYRAAFSDRVQRLGPQVPALMTASEVIKIVSEIVPGASASVEPNPNDPSGKVFLIKGIQERREFTNEPSPNPLLTSTFPTLATPLAPSSQLPYGNALTCALILRNLARAIVDVLDVGKDGSDAEDDNDDDDDDEGGGGAGSKRPTEGSMMTEGRRKKARLQNGEMFGLPIPDSLKFAGQGQGGSAVQLSRPTSASPWASPTPGDTTPVGLGDGVDEDSAGEREGAGEGDRLDKVQMDRVRNAFGPGGEVERAALEWVTTNDKMALYLTEVLECVSLLGTMP